MHCVPSKCSSRWNSVCLYRVTKKSLCTWWLQYRKLQVMFKVSPTSLQTFIDMLNCVLKDHVQYSTVHSPNVFCDGHLQLISCVVIVQIHWVFHRTPENKIGRRKIWRSWRLNGFRNYSVRKHVVQECHRHMCCMSTTHVFLASLLGSFWLLGGRPPGPGGH